MEITSFKHQRASLNLIKNRPDIPYVFLIGGYGCLNGEAEISTPTGPIPLYKFEGGPVNTPIGVRNATPPLHNYEVEQFLVRCANHSFICDKSHLIYTKMWKFPQEGDIIYTEDGTDIVLSVTAIGKGCTYRLHVDEAECYYANGILHHNCGKSHTDVQLLLMLTSAYMYSKTPLTIGIIGVTIKLLTQTVLKDFKAALDQASIPYKDNAMKGQLTIGSLTFIYLAMSNPGDIYAHNFCCALVDEMDELPAEKVLEVVKAVQERCRVHMPPPFDRDPFIFFSTTAQGMGGTYQLCEYFKKRGLKYAIVKGKTEYNTSLAKSQIELLRKLYTEEEAKAYLDGEFVNLTTGRVYPEFNRKKHVCMRFPVQPTETIYVGQDYNCIDGDSLISTDKGLVKMKDIRVGMNVLTRKGYKRVLAHVEKGMQQCEQYNSLIATPDHKAITEGGQTCLSQANTLLSIPLSALKRAAEVEKLLSLKVKDIIRDMIIMSQQGQKSECFTLQYGKQNTEKYLKDILYITSIIISWITGSKTLPVLLFKNIQIYIEKICSLQIPTLLSETRNEVLQKVHGLEEVCKCIKHVQDVERCSLPESVLQDIVPNVEKLLDENYINLEKVLKIGGVGIVYALSAVVILRELYPLSTVLSMQSIGNVRHGKKGIRKVYDITVEDCPEFFADGILVHNCGFNASCEVVERAGHLFIVNSHHWDYMGDAPRRLRQMYPTNPIVMIPDASGKEIMSGFTDEVEEANIQIMWNNKNASITERIMAVNKAIAWGQLSVMEYNEFEKDSLQDKIIMALETRDFDDMGKPRKGKGPNALDHGADSMEYAIWHIIHSVHGYEKILEVLRATYHRDYAS